MERGGQEGPRSPESPLGERDEVLTLTSEARGCTHTDWAVVRGGTPPRGMNRIRRRARSPEWTTTRDEMRFSFSGRKRRPMGKLTKGARAKGYSQGHLLG